MVRILLTAAVACFPAQAVADYSDDCSRRARQLRDAADNFDSQLVSYKSGCDQFYGYSKDDESACGTYGYLTTSLKSAAIDLDEANAKVRRACGTCDGISEAVLQTSVQALMELRKENEGLKKQVAQLEKENKLLKESGR